MKAGLILECRTGGPDAIIYKYVANEICKKLKIEKPETLVNKKRLIEEAPIVTETLIESGCDYVFIIWDRKPRWEDKAGNCITDKATLTKGMNALGLDLSKIFLCCIDEMLESWLIADKRGVNNWIKSKTTHALPDFGDHKDKANQTAPKDRIKNYLKQHFNKWKFNDYDDNIDIVKALPDFNRAARWNDSFRYFLECVEQICPN